MLIKAIFRVTVILSMVASKAAASVLTVWTNPPPEAPTRWSNLGNSISKPMNPRGLNPEIVALVTRHQPWQDYDEAIRVSYAMANLSEIDELDELWASVLIEKHSSEALSTYLSVRQQINLPREGTKEKSNFAESWLWKVSTGSGDS